MRKIFMGGVLIVFFLSCSMRKVICNKDLIGHFYGVSVGYIPNTSVEYHLNLNADHTFNLKIHGHDYRPECIGKWEQIGDTIFLKCNEEKDIGIMLSGGYMNQREYTFKIKSKNILKLDKVVLKRN